MRVLLLTLLASVFMCIDARTNWVTRPTSLPILVADPCVLYHNNSLVVIGGCNNASCSSRDARVVHFSPLTNKVAVVATLPMGVAGAHSAVGIRDTLWVVHACSYCPAYLPREGSAEAARVISAYSSAVRLDFSPSGKVTQQHLEILPRECVVRCNASCIAHSNRVYVVGGIDLDALIRNPGLNATLSTVDELTPPYLGDPLEYTCSSIELESRPGVPATLLSNPTVTANSEAIFVLADRDNAPRYGTVIGISLHPPNATHLVRCGGPPTARIPFLGTFSSQLLSADDVGSPILVTTLGEKCGEKWGIVDTGGSSAEDRKTIVAMPFSTGTDNEMALFSFGGVKDSGEFSSLIYSLQTSEFSTATITSPSSAYLGDNFTIFLSETWRSEAGPAHVRMSVYPECSDNLNGTKDEEWLVGSSAVNVTAVGSAGEVFVCLCESDSRFTNDVVKRFYTPINLFHTLNFVEKATAEPTTVAPSPFYSSVAVTIIISVVVIGLALLLAAVGSYFYRKERRCYRVVESVASGSYHVHKKLGGGGFGDVFLVSRKSDNRQFAVKLVRCRASRVEALAEIDHLQRLRGHPNMIRLVEMTMREMWERNSESGVQPTMPVMESVTGLGDPDSDTPNNYNVQLLEEEFLTNPAATVPISPHHSSTEDPIRRYICIVMDYHGRGDLRSWALARGNSSGKSHGDKLMALPEELLCSIAVQMLSLLHFLHSQAPPVVHCDVKPENILICDYVHPLYLNSATATTRVAAAPPRAVLRATEAAWRVASASANQNSKRASGGGEGPPTAPKSQNETDLSISVSATAQSNLLRSVSASSDSFVPIVLTDFGLAMQMAEMRPPDRRSAAVAQYTQPYLAPELIAKGTNELSPKVDVWAAGCVLYAIATKRLNNDNIVMMYENVRSHSFRDSMIDELHVQLGYSLQLCELLLWMLTENAQRRPTAQECLRCLKLVKPLSYEVDPVGLPALNKKIVAS